MVERHKSLSLDKNFVRFEKSVFLGRRIIKIPLKKVDSFEHGKYFLWQLWVLGILVLIAEFVLEIERFLIPLGILLITLGFVIGPERTIIKSNTNTISQKGRGGKEFLKTLEDKLNNLN